MIQPICGICGAVDSDEDACCINHHDYWIEEEDLYNIILEDYVFNALIPQEQINKHFHKNP